MTKKINDKMVVLGERDMNKTNNCLIKGFSAIEENFEPVIRWNRCVRVWLLTFSVSFVVTLAVSQQ